MRKHLRTHVVTTLAICLIGSLLPTAAFATEIAVDAEYTNGINHRAVVQQGTVVDPTVHAAAKAGVGQVSQVLRSGVSVTVAAAPDSPSTPSVSGLTSGNAGDDETEEAEAEATATPEEAAEETETPTETPEAVATEEPAEEPVEEPTAEEETPEEPTLVPTATPAAPATDALTAEKQSHTAEGVTLQAPVEWEVSPGGFGTLFEMAVPGSDFFGILQSGGGEEFPGIFAVVMFRTAAETLIQEIDPSAELVAIETLETSQQLPVTKISYTANLGGDASAGAFYIVSPGADAYMLITFAPQAEWAELEGAVDLIAESIFYEPSLITLMTAEAGPVTYVDGLGLIEVLVPENWQIAETSDINFPVIVVDPLFDFVGGVAIQTAADAEVEIDVAGILAAADGVNLSDEEAAALLGTILEQLDFAQEEFFINDELSEAVLLGDSILVRLAGDLAISDTALLPVIIYVRLTEVDVAALLMFGEADAILAEEGTLLEILDSAQIP